LLVGMLISLHFDPRLVRRMPIVNILHTMKAMVAITTRVMKVKHGLLILRKKLKVNLTPIRDNFLNAENSLIAIEYGRSSSDFR